MPRPIICQNFDFDRTILKKTRLTTSGTSMPVSSMSTLIAMCGAFSGWREVVDQALGVRRVVGDHASELAAVLGVCDVEALLDELGVGLVLGEDDRLAESVAAGDLVALGHQGGEHLVDGVLVEQEPVELLGVDRVRRPVLAPVEGVPLVLLLLGQLVVGDALAEELGADRDAERRHQEPVADGLVEAVGVGRDAVLEVEEPVGVVVDLVLGGRGQPDQVGVEPFEDRAVLLVDRPVGLVDDDQVEVARTEAATAARRRR